MTQADCIVRWSAWQWAEEQLRDRCQGCTGAGLYDLSGLPRLDACRKPVLRDDLSVDTEVCPVQVAFRARVAARQLLGESNIPRRFHRRTLELFRSRNESAKLALDAARDFLRRWGEPELPGLLIMGPNGTGKTHLAAGIMLALIRREVAVRFYTAPELLARVRDGISRDEADDVQEVLGEIPLLVIDDLGKEYLRPSETGTSWAQEVIYTILNRRYEEDRPVIITTNLTDERIQERYGIAVLSRLAEMCRTVVLDGPDYRLMQEGDTA